MVFITNNWQLTSLNYQDFVNNILDPPIQQPDMKNSNFEPDPGLGTYVFQEED